MKTNAKVEAYLQQLDSALGSVSISEKSEIVLEIKSHIMDAIEQQPDANIDDIFASLGSPEQVANRYLLERGLKPVKVSRGGSSFLKWFFGSILALFAMATLASILMFYMFTPLIEVDEEMGRVQILGGMIDVNEMNGTVKIGSSTITGGQKMSNFSGSKNLTNQDISEISMVFQNAKMDLKTSKDQVISWKCRATDMDQDDFIEHNVPAKSLHFNFTQARGAKCNFHIPKDLKISLEGANGSIDVNSPEFSVKAQMSNGVVKFRPAEDTAYRYSLSVTNGTIDDFENSPEDKFYLMEADLVNGKISIY